MAIESERKTQIITDNARNERDTGSPEVQVSVLNARIKEINEHLKVHTADHASRRGLLQLRGKQKRLLEYLRREDIERYRALIEKLGIRR